MAKYFTLKELTYSATAQLKGIDNTPNDAIKKNLETLIVLLDKIREKYGNPIYINSGYRCPKLNKTVKGVSNSQHQLGEAADLDTRKGKAENKKLYNLIAQYFEYDQLLFENNGAWVHLSYKAPNRKQKARVTQC